MKNRIFTLLAAFALLMTLTTTAFANPYEIIADCTMEDFGQTAQKFTIVGVPEAAANVKAEDFVIANDVYTPVETKQSTEDVLEVAYADGNLVLTVSPFRFMTSDFTVAYVGDENLNLSFGKDQITTVNTETADLFEAFEGTNLVYRLYMPEGDGPFPLVLWTHGGGEKGTNNLAQLMANRGATGWVDYDPNTIVLAPQVTVWGEEQLAEVRQIMLDLIATGKVDTNRIYGSGCSFGGKGIILNAAYNKDLFTAILPCCPSNDEAAFEAFKTLAEAGVKAWIYTAFEDSKPVRHIDWMSKVKALNDAGIEDVAITLLLPEEYNAYGLGFASAEKDLATEYHHTWVLTMRNIRGCLDWLYAQSK